MARQAGRQHARARRTARRRVQGADARGAHPGTVPLVVVVVLGCVAGGWRGGLIMVVVFLPMYLYGAYARANVSRSTADGAPPPSADPEPP